MNLNDVIQILMGGVGTIGFSLLFNVRGRKLFFGTLGGILSWTAFLLLEYWFSSEALRYFLSTAAITVYCEVLARVEKTPTTTFLVPVVIPLIPGSALYYTMNYALNEQWRAFATQAFYTLELALALAVGIIATTTLVRLITVIRKMIQKQAAVHFHHSI